MASNLMIKMKYSVVGKNLRFFAQVVAGLGIHLTAILSVPLLLPQIVMGTYFFIPAFATAGLLAVLFAVYSVFAITALTQRLVETRRKQLKVERCFYAVWGTMVPLWVFCPLSMVLLTASGSLAWSWFLVPMIVATVAYIVGFIIVMVEEP